MLPNVLLIDDDGNILRGLMRALRNQPYQLLTAKSGEEAVSILKGHEIAVIVADENMPGMSGSDLLTWVAEYFPDTVRIILTGQATASTAIRAINDGKVYHFFTKPCNEFQLAISINKAIEHRTLIIENRRLLNTNRQQFNELQQFSKTLGHLTEVVADNLRLPLQKVADACLSLTDQYTDLFDPKAKSLLNNAVETVGYVQHIVDDLLNCSRSSVLNDLHQAFALPSVKEETAFER
jgi:two-component system, probable response regulator PhcQ